MPIVVAENGDSATICVVASSGMATIVAETVTVFSQNGDSLSPFGDSLSPFRPVVAVILAENGVKVASVDEAKVFENFE